MAYHGGQLCLVADVVSRNTDLTYRDTYKQFASDDLGASFRKALDTAGREAVGDEHRRLECPGEHRGCRREQNTHSFGFLVLRTSSRARGDGSRQRRR